MKVSGFYIVILLTVLSSCQKTNVYFKDNTLSEDPNITFRDNYSVALSTYKLDSFITSHDSIWVIGTHTDPEFGKITASSFAEISRPQNHPFKAQNIVFDSAAMVLVPNGNYYGDSTNPFKLNIYTLAENIGSDTTSDISYYNTSSTAHNNTVIGSKNILVNPRHGDSVFIKLNDNFARDLYIQMRDGTNAMNNQASFRSYLKGICIKPDTVNNKAIYQFSTKGDANVIRIYYTEKGLYSENKYYDLKYIPAKQYSNILFDYSGTVYSAFSPLKSQLIESSQTGHKAMLNNYVPSLVKIRFPDILHVTEAYPYVKVMKAELEIRVNKQLNSYPYFSPGMLILYISDQNNELSSYITTPGSTSLQTGYFTDNPLIENGSKYTYDITSYINTIISEGRFSTKSLFLSPVTSSFNSETSRLVLSTLSANSDVRLKLYVLGL